ncbi:MAG: hypothetical protein IJ455_00290 [Agathobacter sp.]|nr:hypothetical protein [Agathobacter sp.]
MSIMSIIFLVGCYPFLFIMYLMFRNVGDKNGYCFGATVSKELRNDEALKAIDMDFRKTLKKYTIILAIVPFISFFIPYISIEFTIWMIWMLVMCFYPMFLYARANKQIQDLKRERGWEQISEIAYTDLKLADTPRKVKFFTFLPTLILSALPVVLAFVLFQDAGFVAIRFCLITFAACTLMFYLFAVLTDRQKAVVISEDSDTNLNFARAKKQIWKNFWLLCAWLNTIFTWVVLVGMYFRHNAIAILIWGSLIYGVVAMVIALQLIKKMNELNEKYESKRTIVDVATDDRHWKYGMMYYNPKDTHVMVENRMGTGTSMNMATGIGKGVYIFAALCLLIIPVMCIWMIMLDFTPIRTEVVDDTIVCTHLSVEYEIPMEEIMEYSVLTEMPHVTKVAGNGMDNVYSGTFEIYREGMFEAFYNPQNNLFIKIETEEELYYISGVDDAETQKVIDKLEK